MFAGIIRRDDDTLLAPAANSGAEKVKLKVYDGKMTNDFDMIISGRNRFIFSFH